MASTRVTQAAGNNPNPNLNLNLNPNPNLYPSLNPNPNLNLSSNPNPNLNPTPNPNPYSSPSLNPNPNPYTIPNPNPNPNPYSNPNPMQQLIKSDRSMFMTSDDHAMMKQIQGTHTPDGREFDIKPLLQIVEDILSRASMSVETILPGVQLQWHMESMEDKTHQAGVISMLEALSYMIDRVSCEIAVKCLSGGDGHQTTLSLFNMLSSYSWDAKLVITLAAFALNYGEFWLLAQIYSSNQLAKSMAILRQLPVILEHSGPLKPRFDALNSLIKAMLDLTRCIGPLKELPTPYVTNDVPALSSALATVPTAVYWTIRGVVACATQITSLASMGHEYDFFRDIMFT